MKNLSVKFIESSFIFAQKLIFEAGPAELVHPLPDSRVSRHVQQQKTKAENFGRLAANQTLIHWEGIF